jgi:Na+/H+ antiporter NhaD/arsenite permease-like protein
MNFHLSPTAIISLVVLIVVYFFLITEKINKTIAAVLGGVFLILAQVFKTSSHTSQEGALEFISGNLDILGFVVGMMILVAIVSESGIFEAMAIWIVKSVKGQPVKLLVTIGYLALFMTTFLSNIPTILILTPVLLVLIRELKLPPMPYIFTLIAMANIGGAMTPISDPTTYYQAKVVGLSFFEVVTNSGVIVLLLSVVTIAYILLVFRKTLGSIKVEKNAVELFEPKEAIRDKKILWFGTPLLLLTVVLMLFKDYIHNLTGITLDNATITFGASFLAILIFKREPKKIFEKLVDWEIIFFFMGLFVVVGALEFTHLIEILAESLIALTQGNITSLLLFISTGSALISTFIDNVPYNITMVGAIQAMETAGLYVYPLWWGLNLGTSIGGIGSPIAAACNVVAIGQAEKEGIHLKFVKYLALSIPLVIINGLIAFGVLWLRYLR